MIFILGEDKHLAKNLTKELGFNFIDTTVSGTHLTNPEEGTVVFSESFLFTQKGDLVVYLKQGESTLNTIWERYSKNINVKSLMVDVSEIPLDYGLVCNVIQKMVS
jgi:hypothetical protein